MQVSTFISSSTSEIISFSILRDNQEIIIEIKPNLVETDDGFGNIMNKRMVGIQLKPFDDKII